MSHHIQPASPPGLTDIVYAEYTNSENNSILTVGSDGVLRQFPSNPVDKEPKELFQAAGVAFNTLAFSKPV